MTTPISFEDAVIKLAAQDGVGSLIMIPGVWEIISEHYNNDALHLMEECNAEVNDEDNDELTSSDRESLLAERQHLLNRLDACGGRNIEIAEQIDDITRQLGEEEDMSDHEHEPNWPTVQPADGTPGIVDIWCSCGLSGSARITPADIQWE